MDGGLGRRVAGAHPMPVASSKREMLLTQWGEKSTTLPQPAGSVLTPNHALNHPGRLTLVMLCRTSDAAMHAGTRRATLPRSPSRGVAYPKVGSRHPTGRDPVPTQGMGWEELRFALEGVAPNHHPRKAGPWPTPWPPPNWAPPWLFRRGIVNNKISIAINAFHVSHNEVRDGWGRWIMKERWGRWYRGG